jgi:hypothetical protein
MATGTYALFVWNRDQDTTENTTAALAPKVLGELAVYATGPPCRSARRTCATSSRSTSGRPWS